MGNQIQVAIVDYDDPYRQRTRTLLESTEGITVVGEARDGQEVTSLIRETDPDVILLGIDTPHANNVETIAQIRESSPRARIIILHDEGQEQLVLDVLRKGALGHLVREKNPSAEIVAAIRAVSRGEAIISSGVAGRILDQVIQERKTSEQR